MRKQAVAMLRNIFLMSVFISLFPVMLHLVDAQTSKPNSDHQDIVALYRLRRKIQLCSSNPAH